MVVLGVDAHKKTHTVVGVDAVGREVGRQTLLATDAGHQQLIAWARQQWPGSGQARLWSVEDCRHVTTRLERALLAAGERVVRVPPKLMAGARTSGRTPGKSDPIDALAVGRVALREPHLPVASHDQPSRELKLLVDFRDGLVARRTEVVNRLRWRLHELDPELAMPDRALRALVNIDQLIRRGAHPVRAAAAQADGLEVLLAIAREELAEVRALTKRIDELHREITDRVRSLAPRLLTLPGCGVLSAAKILAETAGISRFRTADCYAAHAGVAPIPASSGQRTRHRLTRGGNRQLNAAFHRIAITQTRLPGPGRDYYQRRRARGDTTMEAIRVMKRKIARRVYTLLNNPDPPTHLT